jgi:hypothetical protein
VRDVTLVAAAAIGLAVLGCGKEAKQDDPQLLRHDRGDAAPVVVIDSQPLASGGPARAEAEPNDSAESANELVLPAAAEGRLATEKDFDVFVVSPARDGALAVQLSGVDGLDLVLELREPGRPTRGSRTIRSCTGSATS